MINTAKGKYWDRAWSLVEGCTPVSEACENCWLRAMNDRFKKGDFSQVRIRPDRLDIPLRIRKPTVWAVWSDLFHEKVPEDFIRQVIDTAFDAYHHTFLLLTKRPERMADIMPRMLSGRWGDGVTLSNIWLGTTVENQRAADERIQHLVKIPGKKFLSIEPMLGPVDLTGYIGGHIGLTGHYVNPQPHWIHAVILGGESGPKARPMHPDWVRSVRDQCQAAGVPFFFKQWGEWRARDTYGSIFPRAKTYNLPDDNLLMLRIGNKASGRSLDGQTHDDLPWIDNAQRMPEMPCRR